MAVSKKDGNQFITRRQVMQATGAVAASAVTNTLTAANASAAETNETNQQAGQVTCIQYILGRLKELGLEHTFGVPGDYIYDICDAIQDDPDIKGIWCANELNAAYAADGYARTRGVGVAVSTMGAEFSMWNSVAGANAERTKVVFISGIPSFAEMQSGGRLHHMISSQVPDSYDLFNTMVKPITAGGDSAAVITAENCVYETERLIASMLYHSMPVYITIPRLEAHTPVVLPKAKLNIPLANPTSDPATLKEVVSRITNLIEGAERPALLPGYLVRRYNCVEEVLDLVNRSGLPFYTGKQDKAVLSEQHPQFGGTYMGKWVDMAEPEVTQYLDSSDCLVGIGPENHSFNNGFHTMDYELKDTINIMPHMTRIGMAEYANVEMKDVLVGLSRQVKKRENIKAPKKTYSISTAITGSQGDAITYEPLFQRCQSFIKPGDIVVESVAISAVCFISRATFPDGVDMEGQSSMGQLGWSTASMLGMAAAAPERRCIVVDGEGGQQMSINDLGTFARYGIKNPIYLTINNSGYLGERVTNRYPDEEYNDTAPWDFTAVPAALGCKDWYTAKVTTLGELDDALAKASKATSGVYIEIIVDKWELPRGGEWLYEATGAYFGMANRTWDGWLQQLAKKNSA